MAYAVHFRFQWRSANDNIYRIDILEDGYSGSIVQRPLGGAPQLRRNKNGAICGTSLEFLAQAEVDGEFATLYTSDAFAFRVDLYNGETLIWQGYITPELYSEPYVAPPYNVRVTATDNLGELKLSDYTALGRVSISTLISTILSGTGLSFPVHWISTMRPSEDVEVDAEDMPTAATINLDHMAGESQYDVLAKVLDTFHAVIVQHDCSWVIVRETDIEALRDGATVTAPDGTDFTIADFGSMRTHIWWPVGYLSQTVEPAKREKAIAAPNAWIKNLMPDTPDSSSHASYVEPTDGSSPYWLLHPWNGSQQYQTASISYRSPWLDWTPASDLVLMMAIQTVGVLAGHKMNVLTAKVQVRVAVSLNGSVAYRYVTPDGTLSSTAVTALEIDNKYRDTPEAFSVGIPIFSQMAALGYTKLYEIYVTLTTTDEKDGISNVYLFETNVNYGEQNQGYQVTCQLNNDARGKADNTEIAAADNTNKAVEEVFVTNGMKYSSGGASIDEWMSDNILSMPLLEFLARDYCLSIAVPRLRMEGTMNIPAGNAMPLLFRGGGLIYWPETWDWNLVEDAADISMLSLPAAAITVTSMTRMAEGSGGFAGSSYPGGGGVSGPSYFEESGTGVKLLDDYTVLKAPSLEATNNGDVKGTWKGVAIAPAYGGTGLSSLGDAYSMLYVNSSHGFSLLAPNSTTTKKFLSQTGNGGGFASNAPAWSTIGASDVSVSGDSYGVLIRNSSGTISAISANSSTTKKFLAQTGNGSGFASNSPEWSDVEVPAASNSVLGGFKTGFSGGGNRDYAVQLNGSNQAYVNVPWDNTDTTYKLQVNGTWNGDSTYGVSLGSIYAPTSYGNLGNILISNGSGYAPSWNDCLTLPGELDSTSHVALQIGTANTNRNVRVYGALYLGKNSTPSAYLDYDATYSRMHTNTDLKVDGAMIVGGTATNKDLTVFGKLYLGKTVSPATAYIEYDTSNSVIHANVGFYSSSFVDGGGLSSSSDIRLKENLRDVMLTIEQIADAPAVEFDWKDKTRGSSAGSIAQYWEKILPKNVHNFSGHLSMEYGNIALLAAITLAREVKELRRKLA